MQIWNSRAATSTSMSWTMVDCRRPSTAQGCTDMSASSPLPNGVIIARLTWEGRQGISVSAYWRYISDLKFRPYPDFDPQPPPKVPAQSYFDLATIFRVEPNYSLRLGVNNIFDREPPLVLFCGTIHLQRQHIPAMV